MGFASTIASAMPGLDVEKAMERIMPGIWNAPVEDFISEMDEAKIDKAVILPLDYGLAIGEAKVSIEEQNQEYAKMAEQYPDRLIPFFGIDPRREGVLQLFEKAIDKWEMKGLKFHPTSGFYPNDKACYPLYERCQDLNLPVIVHTGPIFSPLKSKFAKPIYLDDVAADFPDLTLIAAHLGYGWWEEAMFLAMNKSNIYLDIAAWGYTPCETQYTFIRF